MIANIAFGQNSAIARLAGHIYLHQQDGWYELDTG